MGNDIRETNRARNEVKIKRTLSKFAEALGEEHVKKLEESSENAPLILREYLAAKYPILERESEELFNEAMEVMPYFGDIYRRAMWSARSVEDVYMKQEVPPSIAMELAELNLVGLLKFIEEADRCNLSSLWGCLIGIV